MSRKTVAELIVEVANGLRAESLKPRRYGAGLDDAQNEAFRAGVEFALCGAAGRLDDLAMRVAMAPVSADPDGLLADFAADLHILTPWTQPKIDDSDVERRIKMARTWEREYAGRRILEILKSYEEG